MNIHIEDKEIFEELKRISIHKVEIGSRMYKTNNEESDTDILYIPSSDEINSISSSHHQYQFKEDGVDHIFTDIFTFIKNSLNGDSTINFEVINDSSLIGSDLEWLSKYKKYFRNYKILRGYLGRARKDLKQMKSKSNVKEMTKKLSHGIRSYESAKQVLSNTFDSSCEDYRETLIGSRLLYNKRTIQDVAREYEQKISVLREKVNSLLDSGELGMEQYMSTDGIVKLDTALSLYIGYVRVKQGNSDYYEGLRVLVADAIANGIDYGDSSIKVM